MKWGCRGRLALGFKPRCGSHTERGPRGFRGEGRGPRGFGGIGGENHTALADWEHPTATLLMVPGA